MTVRELIWFYVFALVVWGVLKLKKIGSREPGLPPGPPTVPLLGNLHIFPTEYAHYKFTEWARIYGDVYSVRRHYPVTFYWVPASTLRENPTAQGRSYHGDRYHKCGSGEGVNGQAKCFHRGQATKLHGRRRRRWLEHGAGTILGRVESASQDCPHDADSQSFARTPAHSESGGSPAHV